MKEIKTGIYKITNQLNNHFYIGQSVNIYKRWNDHRTSLDNTPIHRAIQKYGIENFIFEILEECSQEELNSKEIFWIDFYNGYYRTDCYNCTKGGEGASHPMKITEEQLQEIIYLLKKTKISIIDIASKYNVSKKAISDINLGNARVISTENYPLRNNPFDKKIISKEDIENILIKNPSLTIVDFCKIYDISNVTLIERCKEYGLKLPGKRIVGKIIQRCDKETKEVLQEYPSIREAARQMNCNHNSLLKALKSKTHISQGYYWKEK